MKQKTTKQNQTIKIRKYKRSDREQVELIHFETGFIGHSMNKWLSNNQLYKNFIKYYLEKEPEGIFVVEKNNKVLGYLLSCSNDKNHNESLNYVKTIFTNFFKSRFLNKKDRSYWTNQLIHLFIIIFGKSGELKFKVPENAGHIHINLLPEIRGQNIGSKLLKTFEKYAIKQNIKTIHADSYLTSFNPNQNFWKKNGFKIFSQVKTLAWKKELPKKNIMLTCYVKDIKKK